ADLRFADARIIAYLNFDNAKTLDGSLEDQFYGPAVRCLFELHCPEDVGACGAERAEVADLYPVEICDQAGCEPIAEPSVPGKRLWRAWTGKSRTDGDIGASLYDRSEKEREFGRPITVVAIQKNDNVGRTRASQPRQTCPAIPATRFRNNPG